MDSQFPLGFGLSSIFNIFDKSIGYGGHSAPQYWSALNSSLDGRLQRGVPWPRPCFSWYNGKPVEPNGQECYFVQQNFFNSHLNRSNVFGAYSATQFETCMFTGDECQLDWRNSANVDAFQPPNVCRQGSVADYYLEVKTPQDVIEAFKFAKDTNVPLVIKNTGHDFKGRSSTPTGLALWMHNLKYISLDREFKPEGCPSNYKKTAALTFGAGQQFEEIYKFANDNGLEVVGGSDQSVGAAGGWGQGGGHSSLSPTLGLGADRTLQYKVVTPDGKYRIANACQNEDLFFALRGGGGGTFGVVLEATMMASPAQSMRVANINWNPTKQNLNKVLKVFINNATNFANSGWGGYLTPTIGNLILTNPKLNMAEAQKSMEALLKVTKDLGDTPSEVTESPSYFDWFNGYVQGKSGVQDAIGLPIALSSRLMPEKLHQTPEGRDKVFTALTSAFDNTFFSQIHFTTPFGFKGTDGSDTSVNPLWRSSLYHVILINTWDYNSTLKDRNTAYGQTTKAANFLRGITPNGGAYHNEADIHEPNWQYSFWNDNYKKLVQIKRKYDPYHILDCWQCIDWKGSADRRYSCYI